MFPANSRYQGIETRKLTAPDGTEIAYLARRLVPLPERFAPLREHLVVQGDRPDTIAAQYLGDPEQFWRLCDANAVLDPRELTAEPGKRVVIALPEGLPGGAGV